MNSLAGSGIQYMPPKRPKSKPKKAGKQSSNELAQITKLLQKMQTPKSQVTDLGRVLLKGGNAVSSMFGFPKVFGSGSYTMTSNSLWNATQQVPIMHSATESFTVRHREYIADISMNGAAFTAQTFAVNPGLSASFPFLSSIADNFQEYSFKGLVYEFKTTSASALVSGTNTAMGSVMLAAQYRADAPLFTNKVQMLNEMWSCDTVPSANVVLPVECSPMENVLPRQYVRVGAPSGDIKMFDLCTVTVATQGGQVGQTNVVGELWVSYEVELKKPQIVTTSSAALLGAFATSTTTANTAPFGGAVNSAASNLAMVWGTTAFTFPIAASGYFFVTALWVGTTAFTLPTPVTPPIIASGTLSTIVGQRWGTSGVGGTGGLTLTWYACINVVGPCTVSFPALGVGALPAGTTVFNISVSQAPNSALLWA